jgi:membrane protein EpsK
MTQDRQTKLNFVSNVVNLGVTVALAVFYTPYLVRSLGIAAYGVVPLALIISQYIDVITGSLTSSLTRFYSVALQQRNTAEASRVLSSAIMAIAAIIALLSPLLVFLIIRIDSVFNIPSHLVSDAKLLFSFTLLAFILSLFSSLFNVTLYALNRLDLLNIVKIFRIVVKVLCIVLFFEGFGKRIPYIGYATFIAEAGVISLSVYYFRRSSDNSVKVSPRLFEKSALLTMLSMAVWVLVIQVGDAGLYRIDNVLVNKFWSTRESGILAALSEFGTYVAIVVNVVSSLFGPLILKAYSKGDHDYTKKLALESSLYAGVTTALLAGLLIGFAKPIIGFWLGSEYTSYSSWFIMKLVALPFYVAAGAYSFVYRAWNRVMVPAIVTLVIGATNLAGCYMICVYSNGDQGAILYMLLFSTICVLAESYGLNGSYFLKIYPDVKVTRLAVIFFKVLGLFSFTVVAGMAYSHSLHMGSAIQLLIGLAAVSVVCAGFGLYFMLSREQRADVLRYVQLVVKPK